MIVRDLIDELKSNADASAEVLLDVGETRLRLIAQVREKNGKLIIEMGRPV